MSIEFSPESRLFFLSAGEFSLAFSVCEQTGVPINRYYGPRLPRAEDVPSVSEILDCYRIKAYGISRHILGEYPGWNRELFSCEPALKCTFADGTRDVYLEYRSHSIEGDTLKVTLGERKYPLAVELRYRVLDDCGIIERSAVIRNESSQNVVLEKFDSATLRIPQRDELRLTSLTGKWSGEYRITREKIRDGQQLLQSKSALSGTESSPFFAIDEGDADERRGRVYFGTLLWSGTHRFTVEKTPFGYVSVTAGINNFDCEITMRPGESFETPVLAFGCSERGFGGMSRTLHAYERLHVMTEVERERQLPVVFNAYGTYFSSINEEKILAIIPKAREIGIEAMILDAGWSGEGENYSKGMGVWNENLERFPRGLKAISDEIHRNGMLFGLWMEPECVHKDSDIFNEHPDWVLGYPERGADLDGVRYALNLALDEVRDYITEKICTLIEHCGVDYFKIDFNRALYAVGTGYFDDCDKKSVWVRYVNNLTRCYMTVKSRYPKLLFENCAGGGLRTDVAMLRFAGRINRSDNQDPLDVLKIHEGFSYFMLPKLAGGGCHISDVYTMHHNNRKTPMKYQAEVSMTGSMAIGKNLATITDEEQCELSEYVRRFKEIRPTVHLGDIYRLASAYEKPYAAFEYLYGDEGVLFMLGQSQQFMKYPEPLRLDGLDGDELYEVEGYGTRSGAALMKVGLRVKLEGDFDSRVIRFRRVKQ